MRTELDSWWLDWRLGLAVAVGLAVIAGLLSAWLTPRGPVTTTQALVSMVAALVLGVVSGLVTGSRWSMLITPVVFAVVFELARLGIEGPTVDGIHLTSTYGIIAFIMGRLVSALLVLAPMILGTVYGIWLAARLGKDGTATLGAAGWALAGLATLKLR